MKPVSLPRRLYLCYLSRPKCDRGVYRLVLKHKPRAIVELGMGSGLRCANMLTLAASYAETAELSYAGIDLFEMRGPESPGVTLKSAHRSISPLASRVRLVPGLPHQGIMQLANAVGAVDLILISADQETASLAQSWFYVPRMLHERTRVLVEQKSEKENATRFVELSHAEIKRRASEAAPRRRAA